MTCLAGEPRSRKAARLGHVVSPRRRLSDAGSSPAESTRIVRGVKRPASLLGAGRFAYACAMADDEPRKRPSQVLPTVTFEEELMHWLRTRDELYRLELSDEQRRTIVGHAAVIARKRGMT